MTNEIAKILFIPETFFETVEGRKGIMGLRLAQESQIIELIIQNIEKSSLATKTKEKVYEILYTLQPVDVVEAPLEA